jgi:hypothetical protein
VFLHFFSLPNLVLKKAVWPPNLGDRVEQGDTFYEKYIKLEELISKCPE